MTDLDQRLQPAWGYLQLGMLREANEELEALPPESQEARPALEIRVQIHMESQAWQRMREVSGFLVHEWPNDPQHWIWLAYATRRSRNLREAKACLLDALKHHPREAMIHFNLACYAAQTGDLIAAREHLDHAEALEPGAKLLALSDHDLEPLWRELRKPDPTDDAP